jgi:hypothetical protein
VKEELERKGDDRNHGRRRSIEGWLVQQEKNGRKPRGREEQITKTFPRVVKNMR